MPHETQDPNAYLATPAPSTNDPRVADFRRVTETVALSLSELDRLRASAQTDALTIHNLQAEIDRLSTSLVLEEHKANHYSSLCTTLIVQIRNIHNLAGECLTREGATALRYGPTSEGDTPIPGFLTQKEPQ